MDTIVKYNNQFNQVALRNFSSQELDLLISIASKVIEPISSYQLLSNSPLLNPTFLLAIFSIFRNS